MHLRLLWLLVVLWAVAPLRLVAQTTDRDLVPDSLRRFDDQLLHRLRQNPDLNYREPPRSTVGLWDKLWYQFLDLLSRMFSNEGATPVVRNTVAVLVVLLALLALFFQPFTGLWLRQKNPTNLASELVPDDIHHAQLDTLLAESIAQGHYRVATRLLFLVALRELSKQNLIDWQPEKTNGQYQRELRSVALRQAFEGLVRVYDYVWYGEFEPNAGHFADIETDFRAFIARLSLPARSAS